MSLLAIFRPFHFISKKDLTKWSHLYFLADELGVKISNLIHRLQDLGWIYLTPNSSQICLVTSNNTIT